MDAAGVAAARQACALLKTREAIWTTYESLRRQASKKGQQLQPETLEHTGSSPSGRRLL